MVSRLAVSLGALAALATASIAHADPPSKLECVRANEDAQVLRRTGRFGDARQRLRACAVDACPRAVHDDCAERLAALEAVAPSVVFDVADAQGAAVEAAAVAVDGVAVAVPHGPVVLDPGDHTYRVEASGFASVERKITLREGDKGEHVRVALTALSAPSRAPAPVAPVAPEAPRSEGSAQRTFGFVLGGVGLAALAAGSVLGLVAKSTYGDALGHCPGGPHTCDGTGVDGGERAHTEALASTIAFVAGGALVAGAVALVFTAPSGASVGVEPVATRGGAGLGLSGAW
jgi:hypothetical protein